MLCEIEVFRCVQNCVIVRDGSRTESGNEFHSDGPETEKLLCPLLAVPNITAHPSTANVPTSLHIVQCGTIIATRSKWLTRRPNAQQKTELNSTQLFSSVQFPAVRWTGHDLRRSSAIRRRNWRSSQVLHSRDILSWIGQSVQCLSLDENRRRAATTGDNAQQKTELNSTQLNWTELNDPVQLSWVELSSVFRCALGCRTLTVW